MMVISHKNVYFSVYSPPQKVIFFLTGNRKQQFHIYLLIEMEIIFLKKKNTIMEKLNFHNEAQDTFVPGVSCSWR